MLRRSYVAGVAPSPCRDGGRSGCLNDRRSAPAIKMGIFGKQKAPAEPKMTLELDYPANFAYVGEVEVFLVDGSSEASHGRLAQGQTRSALS